MTPSADPSAPLVLTRVIPAPPARVFAAWTTPADLTRWFGPGEWEVTRAEIDLRAGGAYRFHYHLPSDGTRMHLGGVYREVTAPARLVFTWRSEGQPAFIGDSLVTVDLADRDGATEVRVAHGGFRIPAIRDRHGEGWKNCLDNLEALFAGGAGP